MKPSQIKAWTVVQALFFAAVILWVILLIKESL